MKKILVSVVAFFVALSLFAALNVSAASATTKVAAQRRAALSRELRHLNVLLLFVPRHLSDRSYDRTCAAVACSVMTSCAPVQQPGFQPYHTSW
jgi:hypothetical protein